MADDFVQEVQLGRAVSKWHAWGHGVRHGVDWNVEARVVVLFSAMVGGVPLVSGWPILFAAGTAYIAVSTLSRAVGGGVRGLMAQAEMVAWLEANPQHAGQVVIQPQFVNA